MNLYLMHYGIKGQKWGVRRYLNESREDKVRRLTGNNESAVSNFNKYYTNSSVEKRQQLDNTINKGIKNFARTGRKRERVDRRFDKKERKLEKEQKSVLRDINKSFKNKEILNDLNDRLKKLDIKKLDLNYNRDSARRKVDNSYSARTLRKMSYILQRDLKVNGVDKSYKDAGFNTINSILYNFS